MCIHLCLCKVKFCVFPDFKPGQCLVLEGFEPISYLLRSATEVIVDIIYLSIYNNNCSRYGSCTCNRSWRPTNANSTVLFWYRSSDMAMMYMKNLLVFCKLFVHRKSLCSSTHHIHSAADKLCKLIYKYKDERRE